MEQLEFLRNEVQRLDDDPEGLAALSLIHFPRLFALSDQAAQVHPNATRTDFVIAQINKLHSDWNVSVNRKQFEIEHFMELLDLVCRIRHLTNVDKMRQLIDSYDAGWKS